VEVEPFLKIVSCAIVRGDRVLLMKRTPERGGFWQILTGRMEPHENPLQTVMREIFEETGFAPQLQQVQDLNYVHSFASNARVVQERAFALRVPENAEPKLSDEHTEYRWCSIDEALQTLPFAGLRRAARLASSLQSRSTT
jgi:lipoyl(octanoyl) transferase